MTSLSRLLVACECQPASVHLVTVLQIVLLENKNRTATRTTTTTKKKKEETRKAESTRLFSFFLRSNAEREALVMCLRCTIRLLLCPLI